MFPTTESIAAEARYRRESVRRSMRRVIRRADGERSRKKYR